MAANTGNSFDSSVANPFLNPILFLFELWQWLVGYFLAPNPPRSDAELSRPKVAIIGAGITGVTAAAHCVGHGFDVVIFEAGDEKNLGGIWSKVNSTSSLQIHSLMYRFHPTVQWDRGYPDRQQIIDQVRKLWERYNLQPKTRFNQKITKVSQDAKGRWIINDDENNGTFEGLIAAVGTCGAPQMPKIDGLDKFRGPVYHSSQLTGVEAKGKKMLVVGGGASAVEALEYGAAKGATKTYILSRSDKWIIPRNLFVDILLSLNIFGQETIFSWIPETLLRKFFYRDLEDIAPHDKGIFTGTPMVNSDVMDMMRKGDAEWVRGDIEGFTDHGVIMNRRERGVQPGGPGRKELIEGDMVVLATGFERPSLDFLPKDSFGDKYGPPNWYLQTIPPTHPSVSAINCTYLGAIGTVGNWHIGIYTRILLMFMSDPLTRPSPFWMRRWIDMTKLLKAAAPTGAFDFFTYLELVWWFTFCVTINPFRWKWAAFVFFGVGAALPKKVIHAEAPIRDSLGLRHEVGRDKGVSF